MQGYQSTCLKCTLLRTQPPQGAQSAETNHISLPRLQDWGGTRPVTNTPWHICIRFERISPSLSARSCQSFNSLLLTKSKQSSLQLSCNLETSGDKSKHPARRLAKVYSRLQALEKLQLLTTQRKSSGSKKRTEGAALIKQATLYECFATEINLSIHRSPIVYLCSLHLQS